MFSEPSRWKESRRRPCFWLAAKPGSAMKLEGPIDASGKCSAGLQVAVVISGAGESWTRTVFCSHLLTSALLRLCPPGGCRLTRYLAPTHRKSICWQHRYGAALFQVSDQIRTITTSSWVPRPNSPSARELPSERSPSYVPETTSCYAMQPKPPRSGSFFSYLSPPPSSSL